LQIIRAMSLAPSLPLHAFIDPLALAIVGGGTLIVALLRTPASDIARGLRAVTVLGRGPFEAAALVSQIEALSRICAKHGVIQLDRSVIADRDVAGAIGAIVDGVEPAGVVAGLDAARSARFERHRAAAELWAGMAEAAPAMGLIGTLIGLVRMFTAMTDPAAIGAAMAIALLTTLYGAVLANLVFAPVSARLRRLARAEYLERARLTAPLAALAEREQPRLLLERAA
jgi:chemotaxis protein MotA